MTLLQCPRRIKCATLQSSPYLQICFVQAHVSVLEILVLVIFMVSRCSWGNMETKQWVPVVAMALVFEVMRCSGAIFAMGIVLSPGLVTLRLLPMLLMFVCLCTCVLMGLYFNLAYFPWFMHGQDECSESWIGWMKGMAFSNVCLCLLSAYGLLADKAQAQANPSNVWDQVKSVVVPDPGKRLAHLTLQSFTMETEQSLQTLQSFAMETQSSETSQIQECVVCLSGQYRAGETVTELRCHHTFHSQCIATWIYNGGVGCPMRCQPPSISAVRAVDAVGVGNIREALD